MCIDKISMHFIMVGEGEEKHLHRVFFVYGEKITKDHFGEFISSLVNDEETLEISIIGTEMWLIRSTWLSRK